MIDSKLDESLENRTISHLNTLKNPTQGSFFKIHRLEVWGGSIQILGAVIFVIAGLCLSLFVDLC